MTGTTVARLWQRMDRAERAVCLSANRGCRRTLVRAFFVAASRVGEMVAVHVIPRPHTNLEDVLPIGKAGK
jgi:ethanolamine utilization protein EutM